VTFIVYGSFWVPRTPGNVNFIIITVPDRTSETMPWHTQILPEVCRLVQPWFQKVDRRRVIKREVTFNGSIEYSAVDKVMPDLQDIRRDLHLGGGELEDGSDLLKSRATRRYVWRDKKLEEDTSA